jgi:hypothetical protein
MSWHRAPLWDLRPEMLLSEICGLVSVGRPLWREDGCVICIQIIQWSESRRTRNHTLLSHLRLPQPGGPGSHIYICQEQGGPVIPPGTASIGNNAYIAGDSLVGKVASYVGRQDAVPTRLPVRLMTFLGVWRLEI